jgi:hypothetical protein
MRRQRLERAALSATVQKEVQQQKRKMNTSGHGSSSGGGVSPHDLGGGGDNNIKEEEEEEDLKVKNKCKAMSRLLVNWINNVLCEDEDDQPVVRVIEVLF